MLEQRVAAVLGALGHALVLLAAESQAVRTADAVVQQTLDRGRDRARVLVRRLAERDRRVGRRLLDAGHRAVPAVEHRLVLGHGDLVGGPVERLEVGVLRAAVGVAQLRPRELEVGSDLDQRKHPPLDTAHALARSGGERRGPAQVRGRVLPAVRSREVDQPARGQRGIQTLRAPPRRASSSRSR